MSGLYSVVVQTNTFREYYCFAPSCTEDDSIPIVRSSQVQVKGEARASFLKYVVIAIIDLTIASLKQFLTNDN